MFQDPTSTAMTDGSGRVIGWKTNPLTPPPLPSDGVLLISGPAEVDVGVASDPILISFYGAIVGTLEVSLSFSGANVVPSDTSVELTSGSPSASITVTPSQAGSATVTATVVGLAPASFSYTVITPLPVPDMDLWQYWINPEKAWGGEQGTNHNGDVQKPKINIEFVGADTDAPTNPIFAAGPVAYRLDKSLGYYDGSNGSPSNKVTMTATEVQLGQATPTFPLVSRMLDPGGGGFWVFKHRHKRDEHYWVSGKKWRTKFAMDNGAQLIPWGTELWCAFAFCPTTDQVLMSSTSGWNDIFGLHQGDGSRLKGGPIEFWLDGGNGNAANAMVRYWIQKYENPNWQGGDYSNNGSYIKRPHAPNLFVPVVGTWYYIVLHYREGCGYNDPNHGNIYGPLGGFCGGSEANGNDFFCRVYVAVGSGPAELTTPEYRGFWGSPHDPANTSADDNVLVQPGPHNLLTAPTTMNRVTAHARPGIYQTTNMQPGSAGTERTMIERGAKVWVHQPGMTQHTVLAEFRGS